jgi:hypothetical protein
VQVPARTAGSQQATRCPARANMHVLRLPEPSTAQAAAGCDSVLLACSSRRSRLLKPALFQLKARKCKGVTLSACRLCCCRDAGRSGCGSACECTMRPWQKYWKSTEKCMVPALLRCVMCVCRALCGAPLEALGLCLPALCAAGWHPYLLQVAFCTASTSQPAARPLGCYLVEDSHASCSPLLPLVDRAQQQAHGACLHDSAC